MRSMLLAATLVREQAEVSLPPEVCNCCIGGRSTSGYSGPPKVKTESRLQPLDFCGSVALLACSILGLLCSCGQKPAASESSPSLAAAVTNAPAVVARLNPAFEKLAGRWQRPDGGYVLQISGVDSAGKLEAAYFNPGPIHVSRAMAFKESDTIKLFVELRDTGYPGCTYSLNYDPQTDQLYGNYFQAAMEETFDVTFARFKE